MFMPVYVYLPRRGGPPANKGYVLRSFHSKYRGMAIDKKYTWMDFIG